MRTVRRLLYIDIVSSVTFVALAFLSLFFLFDFIDKLEQIASNGRSLWFAVLAAAYEMPGHFYELFPIAVLIGTIYTLARLAQSSEFTILRTSGLGPRRALGLLAALGVVFAVITFAVGNYAAPLANRMGSLLKAQAEGRIRIDGGGAWLKTRQMTATGEHSFSINVSASGSGGLLAGIRIYEFNADGQLLSRTAAREGRVDAAGVWTLSDVQRTSWPTHRATDTPGAVGAQRPAQAQAQAQAQVQVQTLPTLQWRSSLPAGVVSAAVLPLDTMTTGELWRYSQHLSGQEQAAERYQIRFWKKALYPLACLVMVALALPFAYLHARAGSVSLKVFGGILLGISFVLLNNLAGHVGLLRGWTPWLAAAAPSLLYLMLSLAAFTWLVRYR